MGPLLLHAFISRHVGIGVTSVYMTRGGVTFLFLALCAAAADEPLVDTEAAAKRFFAAKGRDPGAFGGVFAKWRLPDLEKAPFIEARAGQRRWAGWRLDEHTLMTAAYVVVRLPKDEDVIVRPLTPRGELDRMKAGDGASARVLATHWLAALRRDDMAVAAVAWQEFRRRYDDGTKLTRGNTRRYLYGETMFSWRSAWDKYRRTELLLAALDAWESLANDDRQREAVRTVRRGVRATPLQLPPIPENAPAVDRARAMALHLRDLQPCVSIVPGGTLYMETQAVRRVVALGRDAYPALVATLEHAGLTDAWVGNIAWQRDVTLGEAAAAILRRELGFLDTPKVMRAWIASGTWKTDVATGDWFLEHARDPVVQEANARQASAAAARRHFARLYPQAQLAIATRLGDGALARRAMQGLHRCGVDTHPRRKEAVACARRCERGTLETMLEKLRPELQTVVLEALGESGDAEAIPAIVRHLTNPGHVFPPKPERAGPRAVRFYAVMALERLTGQDFGADRAKTNSDWLAAVRRARDWASRRKPG